MRQAEVRDQMVEEWPWLETKALLKPLSPTPSC